MNKLKTLVISLVLIVSSGIASAASVSGNAAITSDYIWRGMTQNATEVSGSVGFDLETDSGFYLGTWSGTAKFAEESGNTSTLELDYYGGYSGSIGDIGYDIGFIEVTYPGAGSLDFSETYLGLDIMGVGLFFAAGDEFGDYTEISYGIDAGPGSIGLSYGDYTESGDNYAIGYSIPVGDFELSFAYTDYSNDASAADDQDAFVVSIGM